MNEKQDTEVRPEAVLYYMQGWCHGWRGISYGKWLRQLLTTVQVSYNNAVLNEQPTWIRVYAEQREALVQLALLCAAVDECEVTS